MCDRLLCIGCSNSILRLFNAGSLQFIATLPKPPPLGRENVASTKELKTLIDSYTSTQVGTEQNKKQQQHVGLSHASVLGVRLSPSKTKVVAVYADRTLVMWDITDTHNVGKYRSFLSHSGYIWDIQCIPSRSGGGRSCNVRNVPPSQLSIPEGTIVTCSADNTIRVWNINALDGSSVTRDGVVGEESSSTVSKMWVNLYSQHLLRILYVNSLDGGMSELPHNSSSSDECNGGRYENENAMSKIITSSHCFGILDVGTLPASNFPMSPHSLAVHPDGLQLACGDKQGNIRVYDLCDMKLVHLQTAHDGEVLCMDYSPTMELQTRSHAAGGRTDEVAGIHNGESWQAIRPNHPLIISPRNTNESLKRKQQLVLLATTSRDRLVHIFDASERSEVNDKDGNRVLDNSYPLLETITDHSSSVTAIKFSKDGRRIATAGGDKTLILNNVNGRHVRKFKTISGPQGTIYGLDVDPTSKYLISTGQDKKVNIWSMATGNLARTYSPGGGGSGDWGEMYKVDLDPTGIYAAICSFDKYIRLFDFYSGRCLCKVSGHSELVTGVRFSLDGRRLISIGGDGCIFIWRLSTVLQQAINDRLCELYPGCVISANKGGEVGVGNGSGGNASPANRDTEAALNRARAKEDAKARLKLHKSQLPAWAAAQMVTQKTQNGDDENASSSSVVNNNKLSSHQQGRRQGESESDFSGADEAIRSGSSSSPKECKHTVPTAPTKIIHWDLKLQQDSGVNAGPIDNSFSHELIDAAVVDGDTTQSNHFEDKSYLYNSSDDLGGGLEEEKTCVEEGVDDEQQEIHRGNCTVGVTAVDGVTYGLNEMNGAQQEISVTTTTTALAPDVVNDVGNKHDESVAFSMPSSPDDLAPPEILHTPSRRPIQRDDDERIDSSTMKRNSDIEEDSKSSVACNHQSSSPGYLCDDASFIKCPNSSSSTLAASDKSEKIVERAKTIDNEMTTKIGVVEIENEEKDNEVKVILQPTQESCCVTNGNGMKRETAEMENDRVSRKVRESATSNAGVKTEDGYLSYDNREADDDEGKHSSSIINGGGENGYGNSGLLHLSQSSSKQQSRNEMNNLKQSGDDSGLCTTVTAVADGSNSKTTTTGLGDDASQIHADSFALELPHPPHGASSPQDKDVSKMHAKRKETEVG